ncbi:hypothetical protein MY3296_009972 [Beauveria thailandica]
MPQYLRQFALFVLHASKCSQGRVPQQNAHSDPPKIALSGAATAALFEN